MKKPTQLETRIQQWTAAGIIDAQSGARIAAFEAGREQRASLQWPVVLALAFGGILFAAGATLFVAAHWANLSPASRYSLVLLMVALLHTGGAGLGDRFPALSTTLHALGTAVLGAAVYLTAQIFNLHENWATGILLWSIGAAAGYVLMRDWIQAALLGLLAPAWLISQWTITIEWHSTGHRQLAMGLILIALTYLSARIGDQESSARRTLVWLGGLALAPCLAWSVGLAMEQGATLGRRGDDPLGASTALLGWAVALTGPFVLAWLLRGRAAWVNVLWAGWAYLLILVPPRLGSWVGNTYHRSLTMTLILYLLFAVGSVGMVTWGLREKRKERLNLGIIGFALSVLFFYFDNFMGKLGRSASLLILGVLCLAGGYVLEILRRRLTARMELSQ